MGAAFFESTVPRIAKALEAIAHELAEANKLAKEAAGRCDHMKGGERCQRHAGHTMAHLFTE